MRPTRIPLFPLEVVLFPGMALPLHIFEPRYKLMVGHCVENRQEFGVVLAKAEAVADVGCTAAVTEVVRKYADGQMDILTEGRARYHVLEVFEEKPYYEAEVEYLADEGAAAEAAVQKKVLELYERCCQLLYGRPAGATNSEPGKSVSFQIAAELPLDLEYKQTLLEKPSEPERQSDLLARLNDWVPQLVRRNFLQEKARGNGHGAA